MITELYIKGFKCFDEETFEIAPLTLLSGLNSSGKSSFLQAINFFYGFKSENAGLGTLSELVSAHHTKFIINLISEGISYTYHYPEQTSFFFPDKQQTVFSYISASRLGPKRYLPLRLNEDESRNVGIKGEFVLDFMEKNIDLSGLPNILCHPDAKSTGVRMNATHWLDLISPGISLNWNSIPKADIFVADFSGRRPANVGFGISYTLPIIANALIYAAMLANNKTGQPLMLIENPEAHLHPAGQTKLGNFLARAAKAGVQIIVETHSDHLLNGIRLAVKDKLLEASKTAFYYLEYDFKEEKTKVKNPVLDEQGFFDEWPDGFFDENEKNLERLLS
jgi:predicted ATPase